MFWWESEVQSGNKKKQYKKRRAKLLRERNLASQILRKYIGDFGGERAKLEVSGCIARDCNIKNGLYQYYFGWCPLFDVKGNGLCSA